MHTISYIKWSVSMDQCSEQRSLPQSIVFATLIHNTEPEMLGWQEIFYWLVHWLILRISLRINRFNLSYLRRVIFIYHVTHIHVWWDCLRVPSPRRMSSPLTCVAADTYHVDLWGYLSDIILSFILYGTATLASCCWTACKEYYYKI